MKLLLPDYLILYQGNGLNLVYTRILLLRYPAPKSLKFGVRLGSIKDLGRSYRI